MMIKDNVLDYLKQVPPSIASTECELCGSGSLVTIAQRDRYGLPVRFMMCRQCALVFINPRWGQMAYAKFYTDYYHPLLVEHGITIAFDNWQERFRKMAQATDLAQVLPRSPRILEIGGGEGPLAAYMKAEYSAEVVIVEPNAREAAVARAKGFEVVADVFENCEFEPASFDLVVLMRTVDHLINASQTFKMIRQLLKPQGKVLLDGVDYFRRMAYARDAIDSLKIDHCYYFSPETLPALMRKCGLQPVISDVVIIPGQVVILAQAGEPQPAAGQEQYLVMSAAYRYQEWEQLANRPYFYTKPGFLIHSLRADLGWLERKLYKRRSNTQKVTD
jgi:SAM-dependent methyltransferase